MLTRSEQIIKDADDDEVKTKLVNG